MQSGAVVQLRGIDAGILMALQAVVYAATKTPGFNIDALKQAATYLKHNTGGVPQAERANFELALDHLIGDVSSLHQEIDKHPLK